MALRIGVNALYLVPGDVGGTEIYLRLLLKALAEIDSSNQYVVFVNRETDAELVPCQPGFRLAREPVPGRIRPARLLWEQLVLPWRALAHRVEVLFNPGFTAPALATCPCVTMFHDLQHRRHPEFFRWFDLPFWRFFLGMAARRSRLILVNSEATRDDLLRYYGLGADRVRLTPLGVDPAFFQLAPGRAQTQPQQYLLCASTLHPHKNLARLVRAWARVTARHAEFRLVLAGLKGFHTRAIERLIADLALGDRVILTGWVPRLRLYELFQGAYGFIYPSLFEGFGMPVLEALAAGIPTACSDIEPLRSLAGEAALLFDPHSEEAIEAAMTALIEDAPLRAQLAQRGPRQAARYSWRRTAELTLAALEEAASKAP